MTSRPDPLRLVLRRAGEVRGSSLSERAPGGIVSVTSREVRFDPDVSRLSGALVQLCLAGCLDEQAGKAHVRRLVGGWPAVPLGGADDVRAMVGAHVLASLSGRPVRVTDAPMGARVPIEAAGFRAGPAQLTRWVELDLDGGHALPAGAIVARLAETLGVPVSAFQVTTSSPRGSLEGRYRARALLERYQPVSEVESRLVSALEEAGLGAPKAGSIELYPSARNTRLPFGWGGCAVVELGEDGVEVSRREQGPGPAMADLGQRPALPCPKVVPESQAAAPQGQALRRLGAHPLPAANDTTLADRREFRASAPKAAARTLRLRPHDPGASAPIRALVDEGCGLGHSDEAARALAQDLRRRFATLGEALEELTRIAPEVGAGSRAEARGQFVARAERTLRRWWETASWRGGALPLGRIPLSHVLWAVQRSLLTADSGRALRLALYGLGWIHAYEGEEAGPQIAWNLWEAVNGGAADYARLRAALDMFSIVEVELTPDEAAQRSLREGQTVEPYSRRWALVEGAPEPWRGRRWVDPHGDPWGALAAVVEASPHINGAALRALSTALGIRQMELAARSERSQSSVSRVLRSASALPDWLREALTTSPGQESTPSLGLEISEGVDARETPVRVVGRASPVRDEGVPAPNYPLEPLGAGVSVGLLKRALSCPPRRGVVSGGLMVDEAGAGSWAVPVRSVAHHRGFGGGSRLRVGHRWVAGRASSRSRVCCGLARPQTPPRSARVRAAATPDSRAPPLRHGACWGTSS